MSKTYKGAPEGDELVHRSTPLWSDPVFSPEVGSQPADHNENIFKCDRPAMAPLPPINTLFYRLALALSNLDNSG